MKINKLMAIGLAAVLAALLASCMPETISVGKMIDGFSNHLKSELQLTADQVAKLQDFTDTMKAGMAENSAASQAHNAEWIAMIETPTLDQAKIREMVKTGAAESAKNTDAWLDRYLPKMAAFHDSLTAEQLKKAANYFQKWSDKFKP